MEKRFIVTNHDYINTGGNSMVSVFDVYDRVHNVCRFVVANEEGFSWQTANTVTGDYLADSAELLDRVIRGSWTWDVLVNDAIDCMFTADEYELYKYCQFEFLKQDCSYFGCKTRLSINELPLELRDKLTPEYIAWAEEEGAGCLTDGYNVFMDDAYEAPTADDDIDDKLKIKLQELKDFHSWLVNLVGQETNEDKLEELYDSYITIAVAGNSIKLGFGAENYNNVLTVIERAIEEF